jgi:signal transduction histidine kinase
MAAVLFGRRAGIMAVALALATILTTFWSFRLGILNPAGLGRITLSGASWLSNAGGVVITAIGPIIAISTLVTQLNAERGRAEAANRAKSNFLATISHELRTPHDRHFRPVGSDDGRRGGGGHDRSAIAHQQSGKVAARNAG